MNNPNHDCDCYDGYLGDGWYCHDFNECETAYHGCDQFGTCDNTPGLSQV